MITFSLLAFYRAHTLASRQVNILRLSLGRQLTAMTLVHIAYIVFTILPFCIFLRFRTNSTYKLIYTITVLIYYSTFGVRIYL